MNLMKLDVETMEEDVLRGSFKTIFKHQPTLYLEADREELRLPLFQFVETLGYEYWLHRPEMIPNTAVPNDPDPVLQEHFAFMKTCYAVNLLCVPKRSPIVTPEFAARHNLKLIKI